MNLSRAAMDAVAAFVDPAVVVVTAAGRGERGGCLVGFFTQCSIDPPRFLACISVQNRTYGLAMRSPVLAVHALSDERRDLAEWFGGQTGDDVDKLAAVPWHAGPAGVPVLDECPVWFAGEVVDRVPFGDHDGFVLRPIAPETRSTVPAAPLRLSAARAIEPGHPA